MFILENIQENDEEMEQEPENDEEMEEPEREDFGRLRDI
jgi:hypothetical protein